MAQAATGAAPEVESIPVAQMSASLNHFAPAFVRVQSLLKPVVKNNTNPHFGNDFADLAAILDEALPILNEHGFALLQFPSADQQGRLALMSMLVHESGQFVTSTMPLLVAKADPQGEGSAITYGRRYAGCAILGIRTVDDDGNAGSNRSDGAQQRPSQHRQPKPDDGKTQGRPRRTEADGEITELPEGWADWAACDSSHAAVQGQIKSYIASLPETERAAAIEPFQAYKRQHGWPMGATLLTGLSVMVAKATKPAGRQRPPAGESAPAAPEGHPEAPQAQDGPEGGQSTQDSKEAGGALEGPAAAGSPPAHHEEERPRPSANAQAAGGDSSSTSGRMCPGCLLSVMQKNPRGHQSLKSFGGQTWHKDCHDNPPQTEAPATDNAACPWCDHYRYNGLPDGNVPTVEVPDQEGGVNLWHEECHAEWKADPVFGPGQSASA